MVDMRISPYLPNFRRTAARIIEPATGASTCALGSQRCVVYIGIFTINAMIVIVHQILLSVTVIEVFILNSIDKDCFFSIIIISLIRRGSEAVMVYIMRYIPA